MKLYQLLVSPNINGTILYLIILLANIDYQGILDYGLKALIGSIIWFGFRVIGDYYTQKIKHHFNHKQK